QAAFADKLHILLTIKRSFKSWPFFPAERAFLRMIRPRREILRVSKVSESFRNRAHREFLQRISTTHFYVKGHQTRNRGFHDHQPVATRNRPSRKNQTCMPGYGRHHL